MAGRPIGVAVVGGGVFASLYLAQARRTPGIHIVGVADLAPARVRERLLGAGWPEEALGAHSADDARRAGSTWLTDDAAALIAADGVEVVIEATGDAPAGVEHALLAIEAGRHVIMVNVEADALVGPLLARRARAAGVVYTLAYGDQPALICELVEWARLSGFEVVCAGKGTKHLPAYHEVTPASVWEHYGLPPEQTAGLNAQMFCSFLDGTKSAVEMAAVANATGLVPQAAGLAFPACGTGELAAQLRPAADGGLLDRSGTLEVVSSLHPDGAPVTETCAGASTSRLPRPTASSRARLPPTASRPRATGAWRRSGGRRTWSGSSSARASRGLRWRASRPALRGVSSRRWGAARSATCAPAK